MALMRPASPRMTLRSAFGFAAHALGEGGGLAVGIATGGRLDGGGVGD